ncbi:hypothetical protein BGP89_14045 [Luteimonas sp. JM171]|uniref:hypothetical protein n=1 Tax=Luteimonas sp. JM171 TaxID=1896164 RepID=UPI0012F765FE|nr:hypothetical protein [Luteimonas sp. JM171]
MSKKKAETMHQVRQRYHEANGQLNAQLELFGDELAEKHKWSGLSGHEAVRFYLLKKHHWLPSQVNAMSFDDLRFALTEELSGWRAPKGSG